VKNQSARPSIELRPVDRLSLGLVGIAVIFASLGMGEAVYRLLFFDFDGATDRLPIEMMFGLAFAWFAMKLVKKIHEHRMLTTAKISEISNRNLKIRSAVETIAPAPFPAYQQPIRVIRDEVDRIEWELADLRS
jgi:hypothetical protein